MPTEVYGCSDDLVEIEGDVRGEVGAYDTTVLLVFNDGTMLEVKYGKNGRGIWDVKCLNAGPLFDRIEYCNDPDADRYSDTAHLKDGAQFAYYATEYGIAD